MSFRFFEDNRATGDGGDSKASGSGDWAVDDDLREGMLGGILKI